MKISIAALLALVLSGCSAHALHQMLTPEPEPLAGTSRLQFGCNANGLYIFEDFPDIVRSHPVTVSDTNTATSLSNIKQNNAAISADCYSAIL